MADAPEVEGYMFLGWGPAATGPGGGWHAGSDLVARCHRCSELINLWSEVDENCRCGGLYKDVSAGRFGHSDGDASIAIYRQTSMRPRRGMSVKGAGTPSVRRRW